MAQASMVFIGSKCKFTKGASKTGGSLKMNLQFFANKSVIKMTAREAKTAAKKLGYKETNYFSHGQPVFKKGNKYISPDVDVHSGGSWKMADSVKKLREKGNSNGNL